MEDMNVDAIVLGLLAVADLAFFKYLRYRRWRAVQNERMALSLTHAVRHENQLAELHQAEQQALPQAS
jgi:hypothetical protein